MNETLDRALLVRPFVFVLGGLISALVNPALQSGTLVLWLVTGFAGVLLAIWGLRRVGPLQRFAGRASATASGLGWSVLALLTGGLQSPFVAAFFFEIVLGVVAMGPRGVAWVTGNSIVMLVGIEVLSGFSRGWLLLVEGLFVAGIGGVGAMLSRRRRIGEIALRTQGEELGLRLETLQRELEDERVISRVGENVARLAHGLKNAVHSLRGFVRLIEPQLDGGPGTNAAVTGLHAAIDDLEKLARMTLDESSAAGSSSNVGEEAGRTARANESSASLAEGVVAARRELQAAIPGVEWVVAEGTGAAGMRVSLAHETLLELLVILMRNAAEAMGGEGRVEVAYHEQAGTACVSVGDEGPGFDPEDLEKIFQPGYTTKAKGSGFGLFLARRIIEDQGGRLELASGEGGGAIVRFELPCFDSTGDRSGAGG